MKRQAPRRVDLPRAFFNENQWQNTIDLFAAETAQVLAELVDVVGHGWSETCCEMVKEPTGKVF